MMLVTHSKCMADLGGRLIGMPSAPGVSRNRANLLTP
jgi:hypothetical protein